jgi:phosphoribosylanthranilate isomerase
MSVEAKICGINDPAALDAAARGGARFIGLNFYPPSPRSVTIAEAAALAARAPEGITSVGIFVDPDDETLAATLARVPLDLIQLHGSEAPRRLAEIRARFELPIMKAVKVARREDLDEADSYAAVADRLLFDAKAPKSMKSALPGGNALAFDWQLLAGRRWPRPWMLSGGLDPENLAEAVNISGATVVDVSSGVEARPGRKDPGKITAFLERARSL